MIHALHMTTWHPYIDGCSGIFVLDQCSALAAKHAKIGLIFSRIEGLRGLSSNRFLRGLPGLVSTDCPVPTLGFKSWNFSPSRTFIRAINRKMLANRYRQYEVSHGRPDILHAHVALESGPAVRDISKKERLEYVITEHSSEILNGGLSEKSRAIAKDAYSNAHCVIAVSEPLAERILEIAPRSNVRVVNNLVRNFVFDLRRVDKPESNIIRIVSVSSLVKSKRINNAIDAIAAMAETVKARVEYHIVGDGPERADLEARATAAGVTAYFHGVQPHHTAMELLSDADLLLHPSSFETFGIVLAEAMAMGIPVIATRCGGPETIVTDDNGMLVDVDDIAALSGALSEWIANSKNWKIKADTIAGYARERFHESPVSEEILKAYS